MPSSEQIKNLRKALKFGQVAFAKKVGISQNAVSSIENGGGMSADTLEKILKTFPEINPNWLLRNEGDMFLLTTANESHEKYGKMNKNKGVPVYSVDFTAGDVRLFQDEGEQVVGYVDFEKFKRCKGFVRVSGDSMEPELRAGDWVGLEPDTDFELIEYGQIYAIITKTNKRLIKIIRRGKNNENLILHSINQYYDDIDLHKDKILSLFRVHGPIRNRWQ